MTPKSQHTPMRWVATVWDRENDAEPLGSFVVQTMRPEGNKAVVAALAQVEAEARWFGKSLELMVNWG